jgi:hypothetical protein
MKTYSTQQFLQLEKEVWSALVSGDSKADSRLLTDDFLGVYSSGFAGKSDHIDQLMDGPTVAHYEILEERIQVLSEETVLLSYLTKYAPCKNGEVGKSESMYVTSIWRLINGVWKNSFSQDTPIDD